MKSTFHFNASLLTGVPVGGREGMRRISEKLWDL